MNFERHVFISYAHLDNLPLLSAKEGWVSVFHKALNDILSGVLGAEARIWRDEKLNGNDVFADEIVAQFPTTAALISVLSPRYINSTWCNKEAREFCEAANQRGGLVIDNMSRVFKVIKTPIDREDVLPGIMAAMLGYEFYELDERNTPVEFDPCFGDDNAKREFLNNVRRLAWDIKRLLAQLDSRTAAPAAVAKPVVYLAECSRDLRTEHDALAAELKRLGYAVLPDRPLARDEDALTAEVDRLLAQSALSVHLIGSSYGWVPDGASGKSVAVLQNERAVQRARASDLKRIIWIPGRTSADAAQTAFADALHQDAELQYHADLLTDDLEGLKCAILTALRRLEAPAAPVIAHTDGAGDPSKLVYLLCVEADLKNVLPLVKYLTAQRLTVRLPPFSGEAAQIREANRQLYVACDAVILFYGAGDEAWKISQESCLRKLNAEYPEKKPIQRFVCVAEPGSAAKEFLLSIGEKGLIDLRPGFSESPVAVLVQSLAANGTTTP